MSKVSSAFGRLWTRVWRERGITQATKLAVYRAVVLIPNLVVWLRDVDTLPQTPQDSGPVPRPLPCISWEDRVTNQEVLRRSRMPGVEVLIMKAQLRWTGHVMRMRTAVFQNRPSALNWLEAIAGRGGPDKALQRPSRTLCAPVTSLLKPGSILHKIVALGGWRLTTEPKPSRKGDCHS